MTRTKSYHVLIRGVRCFRVRGCSQNDRGPFIFESPIDLLHICRHPFDTDSLRKRVLEWVGLIGSDREQSYLEHLNTDARIESLLKLAWKIPIIHQMHTNLLLEPGCFNSFTSEKHLFNRQRHRINCASPFCSLRSTSL